MAPPAGPCGRRRTKLDVAAIAQDAIATLIGETGPGLRP